jgi:hypothetical protein
MSPPLPCSRKLIEAEDLTLRFDHEHRVIGDVAPLERKLGATGCHERSVVAPERLRGQGEAGQASGIGRLGAPDAGGNHGSVRAGQRRWYCLLPNMISHASLSAL